MTNRDKRHADSAEKTVRDILDQSEDAGKTTRNGMSRGTVPTSRAISPDWAMSSLKWERVNQLPVTQSIPVRYDLASRAIAEISSRVLPALFANLCDNVGIALCDA